MPDQGNNLHDYVFPLMEADYVNLADYKTDLWEFFQAMQCRKDRKKLEELFQQENFRELNAETEQMIARRLHVARLLHKMKREKLPMCKAFHDLMEEKERKGRKEGRREGKKEGKKDGKREEKLLKCTL